MQIFIVAAYDYDSYSQHGVFATREQADAYVAMVRDAERQHHDPGQQLTQLTVDTFEVDELVGLFPVFAVEMWERETRMRRRVMYLREVPQTEVRGEPPYAVEAYGLTPGEAKDRARQAKAAHLR